MLWTENSDLILKSVLKTTIINLVAKWSKVGILPAGHNRNHLIVEGRDDT